MISFSKRSVKMFLLVLSLLLPQLSSASDQLVQYEHIPKDVRQVIFTHVVDSSIVEGKSFGALPHVNKQWAVDFLTFVEKNLQPWQHYWKAYLGVTPENELEYRALFNGTLEYRKRSTDKKPEHVMPLLPLMNLPVRSLDLPADIALFPPLITNKVERFFKVEGRSAGQIIRCPVLFVTKSMFVQGIKFMQVSGALKAKLDVIITNWKAPIGVFWRRSDNDDLTCFAYNIEQEFSVISNWNLMANWSLVGCAREPLTMPPVATRQVWITEGEGEGWFSNPGYINAFFEAETKDKN